MPKEPLINVVGRLLTNLGFEAYWPNHSIDILKLKTQNTKPDEIEIDIIAKLGNVGFLVETTTQKEGNEGKIEKFLLKYNAIKNSKLSNSEIAKFFSGIPKDKIKNFDEIKEWRLIYIGTSPELIYKKIKSEDFGFKNELKIINIDDWFYITKLADAIGEYAKFELISFLEVEHLIEKNYVDERKFDFYRVKNREITEINGDSIKADIFLFSSSPEFLLKLCRVPRFYGLKDSDVNVYYQRMVNKNKLEDIRKKFIKDRDNRSFPTPITIILPAVPEEEIIKENKFPIKMKYGSICIIDGQHRLYSYTELSERIKKEAEILVNGIKFHIEDPDKIGKFSAKTFIDINREQVKVKTSLFYLIAYDCMGDTSNEAISGKIISLCNYDSNSPLHDLFEGRALGRKSKLMISRINVTEVTNKLSKIVKELRENPNGKKV